MSREYENAWKMPGNRFAAISIFLGLMFIDFLPGNVMFKALSVEGGIGNVGAAEHDHDTDVTESHSHTGAQNPDGIHAMADGTIMNRAGEVIEGAHQMPDGSIMLSDGTTAGEISSISDPFSRDITGLPEALPPETVVLNDGDSYDIAAYYVKKEVGNRTLRMLAYNGSVPGPFIKVDEGTEITINFTNNSDLEQTIHSHGVRIDNNSDGVPGVTQDALNPGEAFTYTVKFEDAGVYWYHPHTRDDYGQEMGLYGNYLVDPEDPYLSPANREIPLVVDDILIEDDKIAEFFRDVTNFALLGRFGNEFLVNGERNYTLSADRGEVIRFLITNVSNARTYRLSIPGAQMKLIGTDVGQYEHEMFVDDFLISPAERMIVAAHFEESGVFSLMHTMPDGEVELTRFLITDSSASPSYKEEFNLLKTNQVVVDELSDLRTYLGLEPDKKLLLTVQIENEIDHSAHQHSDPGANTVDHSQHNHSDASRDRLAGIQWEDKSASDRTNTTNTIAWKMIDEDTGKESMMIPVSDWTFKQGDYVKIRFTNDANADHVMQHPIHLHGQRFVVLTENGSPSNNLVWKDTTLVFPGEVVEIVAEMSNLGEWMSHCHISEHLHAGMMMQFRVEDEAGYATGDEFRATVPQGMNHADSSPATNIATQ